MKSVHFGGISWNSRLGNRATGKFDIVYRYSKYRYTDTKNTGVTTSGRQGDRNELGTGGLKGLQWASRSRWRNFPFSRPFLVKLWKKMQLSVNYLQTTIWDLFIRRTNMNIYKFHNGAFLGSASITYSTTDYKLIIWGLSEDEEADFISSTRL